MKSKTAVSIGIFAAVGMFVVVQTVSCVVGKQQIGKNSIYINPVKPIQCDVGEVFSIVLDSNPSTGYQWRLSHSSNEELLKLVDTEYRSPKSELTGAGGQEIWSFKALSSGQGTIVFEYTRSWEMDKKPANKMTFIFNIQ